MKTAPRNVIAAAALGISMIATTISSRADSELAIRNQHEPSQQILAGGQPTAEELQQAAREGFRTIVSLRPSAELDWDEKALVEDLGLEWVHIPIASVDDLTPQNAELLAAAIAGPEQRPALVHCASGNRVGALFAVMALHIEGLSADSAVEIGVQAGLTSLRAKVKELLDQSAAVAAPKN